MGLLGGRGDSCCRSGVRGITGANYGRAINTLLQSFQDVLGHLALLALVGLLSGCDDSHPAATTLIVVLQTGAAVLLLQLILFRIAENLVKLLLVFRCCGISQVMTHISIPANLPTMLSRPRLPLCPPSRHIITNIIPHSLIITISSHHHTIAIVLCMRCNYWLLLFLPLLRLACLARWLINIFGRLVG